MTYILDFSNPHFLESELPPQRSNLKLMLWAGDGNHDGVSDVQRLAGYDVYLCLGIPGPHLQKNIADLTGSQTLCMINVNDTKQMAAFEFIFKDAFSIIDTDYYGNTPTLSAAHYLTILERGGRAYNTEGINSLVMPTENLLNTLEIFVPILTPEQREQRTWSVGIIELAKRDDLPASHVWASPDLKHTFYDRTRDLQEHFVTWQKQRNPAWPKYAQTLEEQWNTLPIKTLCAPLMQRGVTEEVANTIQPYLETFSEYLGRRVLDITKGINIDAYMVKCENTKDINDVIRVRQKMLVWFNEEMPAGLSCAVGHYPSTWMKNEPVIFGMCYVKGS